MRKRIVQSLILLMFFSSLYLSSNSFTNPFKPTELVVENPTSTTDIYKIIKEQEISIEPVGVEVVGECAEDDEVKSQPVIFPDAYYNPENEEYDEEEFWDDMELVALVCVAEAEGETEKGKRLVIDTIFNRLESPYYPNKIHDVVYQRNPEQYSCVWNGRLEKVEYNEYIANLVIEEMNDRTNPDVIYFKTNGYFNFGTPITQEGNHFFNGR